MAPIQNPLARLALDHWYKALVAVGFAVFLMRGAGLLEVYPLVPTVLISLGVFLVGLGEWMNHPFLTEAPLDAYGRPQYIVSGYGRRNCLAGVLLDVLGAGLMAGGVYRLF